jgi:aldehyde:ferredoxin oxidoreductase
MALNPSGPRYDVIEHDIDFDPNWVWNRHVEYGGEYGIPKDGIPLATLNIDREKSIGDLWLLWSALDALGVCIYSAPPTRELRSADVIEMVKSELNRDVTMPELFELGLMRLAIQRDINQKLGLAVDKDNLPEIFFNEQISDTNAALNGAIINKEKFKNMKSAIIKRLGWKDYGGVDKTSIIWQKCEVEIGIVESKITQLCE